MAVGTIVLEVQGGEKVEKAGLNLKNLAQGLRDVKEVAEKAKKVVDEFVKTNETMGAKARFGADNLEKLRRATGETKSDTELLALAQKEFGNELKVTSGQVEKLSGKLKDQTKYLDENTKRAMAMRATLQNAFQTLLEWATKAVNEVLKGAERVGKMLGELTVGEIKYAAGVKLATDKENEQYFARKKLIEQGREYLALNVNLMGQLAALNATVMANYNKATGLGELRRLQAANDSLDAYNSTVANNYKIAGGRDNRPANENKPRGGGGRNVVAEGLSSITAYEDPNRYHGSTDLRPYQRGFDVSLATGNSNVAEPVGMFGMLGMRAGKAASGLRAGARKAGDAVSGLGDEAFAGITEQQKQLEELTKRFGDFRTQAIEGLTSSIAAGITAVIEGTASFGAAMGKMLADRSKAVRNEAVLEAAKNGAYAVGKLAVGDYKGAALHGLASAKFLAVAGLAQGAAVIGGAMGGGAGAGASAAFGGPAAPDSPGTNPVSNRQIVGSRERDSGNGPINVTINYTGGLGNMTYVEMQDIGRQVGEVLNSANRAQRGTYGNATTGRGERG